MILVALEREAGPRVPVVAIARRPRCRRRTRLWAVARVVWPALLICLLPPAAGCGGGADAAAKPPITDAVDVSVRPSLLDRSRGVLRLRNPSGGHFGGLELRLSSAEPRQSVDLEVGLGPGETKEFGWREGWDLVPGEQIMLSHPDYKTVVLEAFRAEDGSVGIRDSRVYRRYRQLVEQDKARELVSRIVLWVSVLILTACAGAAARQKWQGLRAIDRSKERPTVAGPED